MKRSMCIVGAVLLLALPSTASAAAPTFIMVTGPTLARPVLIRSVEENAKLLLSLSNARAAPQRSSRSLQARPKLRLWLFWGWREDRPPRRPSQANDNGVYYPSFRGKRALILLRVEGVKMLRVAPPSALRLLARHGVPTKLNEGSAGA
jgi:hypothetical protein